MKGSSFLHSTDTDFVCGDVTKSLKKRINDLLHNDIGPQEIPSELRRASRIQEATKSKQLYALRNVYLISENVAPSLFISAREAIETARAYSIRCIYTAHFPWKLFT